MKITGIGARETPSSICNEMTKLGNYFRECNYVVRSGGARGADTAFQMGARERTIVYQPWPGFVKKTFGAILWTPPNNHDWNPSFELASKFHPHWEKLTLGVKKLMARNGYQVLGINLLPSTISDVVICWTPGGIATGGTSQAIRIANYYGIQVINMFNFFTVEKVIERLVVNKG